MCYVISRIVNVYYIEMYTNTAQKGCKNAVKISYCNIVILQIDCAM